MDTEAPLGLLLIDSARLLRARFDHALECAALGLTSGEARALVYAHRHPASRQTALAAHMGVEPMTLVRFLDRLEACGYIQRLPDPEDRRAKIVCLAPDSTGLVDTIVTVLRRVLEDLLQDFTQDEIKLLKSMLSKLRTEMLIDSMEAELS